MESQPYYSVIVPVYNVKNRIERCIKSILYQSFKDFELILIDDGASDGSGDICDKYAKIDQRIVVIHQKNQGVSVARNKGIENATGKYIVFVDSDDFVAKDILARLDSSDLDLVSVGFSDYFDGKVIKTILDENESWEITSDEGILRFLKKRGANFVWGKRYKKSIIDKNGIRFHTNMKFCEDNIFNNDYILKAGTIANIKCIGYYHCQDRFETLTSKADKLSFVEKTQWRKVSYNQFVGHPMIQKIYTIQMIYFAEKEIAFLANKNEKLSVKYESIKRIINDEFFQLCINQLPEKLSFDVRIFCKLKLIVLIIFKYKRKSI